MVNWFVQTVRIFTCFSIQTIQTLNFIFVSALILTTCNAKVIYRSMDWWAAVLDLDSLVNTVAKCCIIQDELQ